MNKKFLVTASIAVSFCCSMANCSTGDGDKNEPDKPDTEIPGEPDGPGTDTPDDKDPYEFKGSMQADAKLVGQDYKAIHQYMRGFGWDYSEHPNSSEKDHHDGVHAAVVYDEAIGQYVFRFFNHANADVLDGDRGSIVDRQRNEMKSQTSDKWFHLNGNWGERQRLKWKFKLPAGFRPSTSF